MVGERVRKTSFKASIEHVVAARLWHRWFCAETLEARTWAPKPLMPKSESPQPGLFPESPKP